MTEYDKILFSRLLSAFLWTVALQVFPLCLYVFLTNFDVLHPGEGLIKSTWIAFRLSTWFCLMPIHVLIFAIGYIKCQELKKPTFLVTSRFRFACSLFRKTNVFKFIMYVFFGFALPWIYMSVNSFQIWIECQEYAGNTCLNENSVFIMASSLWTSLFCFIQQNILNETILEFPIIRQFKFLQIRYKFLNLMRGSLVSSLVPLIYYLPFYIWKRKSINLLFELILTTPVEFTASYGIFCLLNIWLLINAWLISTAIVAVLQTINLMIEIHFTEHYSFDLIKQPNSKSIMLSTALGEQSIPIIQYLASYDLYILAMSQKSNRWQIFTLSQPGGHPHTWNAILHESLRIIDEFICKMEAICKVPDPVKPKSPVPKHVHARNMTGRHEEILMGPVPLSPTPRLRNLMEQHPGRPLAKEPSQRLAVDEFWLRIDNVFEKIKQNSIINYTFGSKPDAEIRFLLSKAQPLIWVVQSISELSANALYEDQFGIVLKDLPRIISTLLQLKSSTDKLVNIQSKFQKSDHELCMKASLKSALRRSLYRIAIAYSDYLTDLPLSTENLISMKNYVNFKEC